MNGNNSNGEERRHLELVKNIRAVVGPELYSIAKVEGCHWYMGLLARNDVEPYLKKQGDYAVRACDSKGVCELVLSVRGINKFHHVTLICDRESLGWSLTATKSKDEKTFKTVTEMVNFYAFNDLPMSEKGIRLLTPCKRPRWILKRENLLVEEDQLLGSGNFCDVYRGKLNKRRVVAIKVCHKQVSDSKGTEEDQDRDAMASNALIQEGSAMSTIRHNNVISFYGICCDKPPVMIAMELCPGGSLLNHLINFNDKITVGERLKFSSEAAEGMKFLHDKELVHRDLAARNCLLSKFGIVKIADFGLSKIVSELSGENVLHQQVPLRWLAPETLTARPMYSTASDVWAYGMLLFEIFSNGEKPWADWENKKIATYIRKGQMLELPSRTPDEIKFLVKEGCWVREPDNRYKFGRICSFLSVLQSKYRYPRPTEATVSQIPGVSALSEEEIAVLQETTEDIAVEAAVSAMSYAKEGPPVPVVTAETPKVDHARERELTVEEPGALITSKSPLKRKKNRKNPQTRRKVQKETVTSHEQTAEDMNKEENPDNSYDQPLGFLPQGNRILTPQKDKRLITNPQIPNKPKNKLRNKKKDAPTASPNLQLSTGIKK